MDYVWDIDKNRFLKKTRKISFERVITAIEHGDLIDILEHKNSENYTDQKLYIIRIDNYCWVVPYRDYPERNERKLITAFPSRKLTKQYLR